MDVAVPLLDGHEPCAVFVARVCTVLAMMQNVEAFPSSTRRDDIRDEGRVFRLAHLSQDELTLMTGSKLDGRDSGDAKACIDP